MCGMRTVSGMTTCLLLGSVLLGCPPSGGAPEAPDAFTCGPAGGSAARLDWPAGSLVGTVSSEAGRPLSGARVMVEGTGCAALSGDSGAYSIARVPAGTHTVVVQIIGYETLRRSDVGIADGDTTKLDLILGSGTMPLPDR